MQPDRAVVDCVWCSGDGYVTGSMPCPECTPQPRALVALSEDRQWLVVLEPERWSGFGVYRREWMSGTFATSGYWHWVRAKRGYAEDTGQSADEVLAAFLEGRHDGR